TGISRLSQFEFLPEHKKLCSRDLFVELKNPTRRKAIRLGVGTFGERENETCIGRDLERISRAPDHDRLPACAFNTRSARVSAPGRWRFDGCPGRPHPSGFFTQVTAVAQFEQSNGDCIKWR